MTWGEAIRLTQQLQLDPSSHVSASVRDWTHPLSYEAAFIADLVDVQIARAIGKKAKSRPRPWDPKPKRWGSGRFTIPQLRELLRRHREG